MMVALHRLVASLERHGSHRTGRTSWTCPAHDDHRASLSVSSGSDRALFHCHAGCDPTNVLSVLGLTWGDLFDGEPKQSRAIVATYDYTTEAGDLLFQVVRFFPKEFRQRRPVGDGWTWSLDGVRRVPYRLPRLLGAVREGKPIYVVEGEKDVHAIERAGAVATTIPGGAGKWRNDFAKYFPGATVIVVADDDEPGRRHAQRVAKAISVVAVSVQVVLPAEGKDAADHLAAGRALEDFLPIDEQSVTRAEHLKPATTVRAIDVQPEPVSWLRRDWIPRGMPTVIGGFPGVGKSSILYDEAARVSREGSDVVVATAEDHLAAVARPRLEAAGANLTRVHFLVVPLTLPAGVPMLRTVVREREAALLILDPLVAFIGDEVNTHRDHHVRRVLAPLADLAEDTGAAILVVIHTNKDAGNEPLMRISGSIGFTGAARAVLLAAEDPQDETRRILAVVKSNLAPHPAPLAYRITGVDLDGGISTSRIEWMGEAPEVDPRELLLARDPEERNQREEAIEFLRAEGVPTKARLASDLLGAAAPLGISDKTLQRARRALHIPAWRTGFQGPFFWGPRPPANLDTQPGQPHPVQVVHVGDDRGKQGHQPANLDTSPGVGEAQQVPSVEALIDADGTTSGAFRAAQAAVKRDFPSLIALTPEERVLTMAEILRRKEVGV